MVILMYSYHYCSVASADVSRCQTPAGSQKDIADKNQGDPIILYHYSESLL